jgi:hypothetical protein
MARAAGPPSSCLAQRSADCDGDALDAEEFFEARLAAFLAHPPNADAAERAMWREGCLPCDR